MCIRDSDETVLLNITGGGEKRLEEDRGIFIVDPIFIYKNIGDEEIEELLCRHLKKD